MKKTLLSCMLLAGLSANAQLADGSIAPNFTFTDIDGTEHTLYDYLDDGKTVIIDISAAWCGPCWNYHQTHALRDLYEQHGPAGAPDVQANTTDDVMVFYVEGQLTNTAAQLTGTSTGQTQATFTQGDWVTGTTYPIIDLPNNTSGQAFMSGYAIGYFPTVYMICPNRILTEVGAQTAANLYTAAGTCPEPASAPADVAALAYTADTEICPGTPYVPTVRIQNNGTTNLTNATVTITQNGNTVSTGTYSGNLATYGVATITCSSINSPAAGNLVVTVTTTNDALASNGNLTSSLSIASAATSPQAVVKIVTDRYGDEFSWNIKNSNGVTVASGGPYTTQSTNGAYPQADVTFTMSPSECYAVTLLDSYGDGFNSGYGNGSFKVLTGGTEIVSITNWTNSAVNKKVVTNANLNVNELGISDLSIYPNPATDVVNVSFEALNSDYVVSLVDLTGRVLMSNEYKALNGAQVIEMPVSVLAKGNYLVKITANGASLVQQVAIK